MKKNILLLIVIFSALFFIQPNISDIFETEVVSKVKGVSSYQKIGVKYNISTKSKEPMKVTDKKKDIKAEVLNTSRYVDDIFVYEELEELITRAKPKSGIKPLLALSLEHGMIKSLEVGDIVVLPVVGEIYYEMEITQKISYPNSSISVDGIFTEDGLDYTAILTEGNQSSFVSMTTPQGAYEVEIFSGLGYMYSVKDIEKVRVDTSLNDILDIGKFK